ncbi:MAG: right-handed parallel beta-helix repeat-containing protein, partial [Chloroflexota bacterium]
LNRGNTASGRVVFEFKGADDLIFDHLAVTGGQYGFYADTVDSNNLAMSHLEVYGNTAGGIYLSSGNDQVTLRDSLVRNNGGDGAQLRGNDSQVHDSRFIGNTSTGLTVYGLRGHIHDNEVWGNGSWGIVGYAGSTAESNWVVTERNRVFDNAYGIYGSTGSLIRDNESWGQSIGIQVEYGGVAEGNEAWANTIGIRSEVNAIARDNRVWGNSTGMDGYNGEFDGNRVYGNGIGISDGGYGRVHNNLVYDNTSIGIQVTYSHTVGNDGVINNTVHQVGGKGIDITSSNVTLRNNILWQDGGTAITVSNSHQGGFNSDYNLFHLTGGAQLAWWEDRTFADRADWTFETGFDAHSLSGDPQFVDIDGGDNVNGWNGGLTGFGQAIDDEGAGHAFSGAWTENASKGFAGDFWSAPAGSGQAKSTWTFSGLEAGVYRIAATWPYEGPSASNARFSVYDGNGTPLAYRGGISQNYVTLSNDASSISADGAFWQVIGYARLEGDSLVVELTDYANGKVLADAVRIDRLTGDFGADDDYRLQAGSPGVDRGSLNDYWLEEPQPNGGRIDLGAYGNTALATGSADPMIQVTSMNGLEKLEVGQDYEIYWRSAGLTEYDSVALINVGSGGQVENWLGNAYQTLGTYNSNVGANQAIDRSGATNPAPEAVYRSYAYNTSEVNTKLAWDLPLDDGDYRVRLHFSEPNYGVGTRRFDIQLNGTQVADDYDIRAAAGALHKAVVAEYDVSLAGGAGLLIELINQTVNYPALLSGIEILKANAQGVAAPTADLEVSLDNGASWTPIASGLAMDRYGRGSYTWTPTQETAGNTALIRAIGHAGVEVSDVSDEGFLIANGGAHYYVNLANDADFSDNETTTAAGDNEASGKTADAPMASLAALLRAYDLDAGDIIHVDTGSYSLATNIVLEAQDSGVTIEGAKTVGHVTTLNRGNTASGRVVFEFKGADDLIFDHLAVTGGQYGFYADTVDSDRITVQDSSLYGNAQDGLYFEGGNDDLRVLDSRVYGNGNQGLETLGARALIQGNEIYGNGSYGLYTRFGGSAADRIVIRGNVVHDNANHGIYNSGAAWIVDNDIYGHTNTSDYGVVAYDADALVEGNDIHGNYHGIVADYGALVTGNEIYGNSQYGVYVGGSSGVGASIDGNRIYGNSLGIVDSGYGHVVNNVLYTNTNVGLSIAWRHQSTDLFSNNTIYQPVGDAIRVTSNAEDARLFNNILWVAAGYGINVNPGGVSGLLSDHNLIHTAGGAARAGLWSSVERISLADWQVASSKDAHSVAGNPLFLDIDGADNVLGAAPSVEGSGHDDNFGLKAHSPAIDAANAYQGTRYDIEGRDRHDDPSSVDSGDGWPLYVAGNTGNNQFVAAGTAKPYQTSQGFFTQALGFNFNFYGSTYTSVVVSSEGYLQFAGPDTQVYQANSLEIFQRNAIIAPFWDNLTTSGTGRNIYVDSTTANQITIRWSAALQSDTSKAANFAVTLFADGSVRFDYGAGNTGFAPRVGVSAGNGYSFVLGTGYDGAGNLASANSLLWQATPGLDYYDIGAYEFQGDSNDIAPPTVTGIPQLPPDGGTTALAFSSVQVSFSESLDGISARSPANYELLYAGADGVLDTLDDVEIGLTPAYSFPETDLTLQFAGGALADGLYRLRLSGTLAIYDTAGNPLDGDYSGAAGGDYLHVFSIDRSANTLPEADAQVADLNEDGSVLITLTGDDADGDLLAFGLFSNPAHGTLSGFDPVTRQVTYTPHANYWGPDSFQFQVDDGKLGTATATVSLNVLPANDAPEAPGQTVNLSEDTQANIVLPASDLETLRAGLTFSLVDAPLHGSLVQGANGVWTYIPDPDYSGTDSFTYTVTDRGGNDADPSTALTSSLGLIDLVINPDNDTPTLDAILDQMAVEGQLLNLALIGHDPEGQALTYSLLSGPAGAVVDSLSGLFTWT